MRIVQIIPGTGGTFYCQNCLRDLELVRALRQQGHDVLVVPIYLPLTADDPSAAARPAFYSAVSLYVRHTWPTLARCLPAAAWRRLESMSVLRFAARRSGSTRAAGLGDITVSMLRGEEGRQAAELERLAAWLRDDPSARPEVVVLSNLLLLGLARRLKTVLRVPVVCWLQDEHVWADAMTPDEARHVWQAVRERVADADGLVTVSQTYAERMRRVLELPAERIRTIYIGAAWPVPAADPLREPPTIGFLSRLCAAEGFGLFVDAFLELHRDPHFARVRMKATGGMTDRRYVARQMRRLRAAGLADLVEIEPDAFRNERGAFLASLTLLSAPVPAGDAFGTYAIEAMAAGVPVVEPAVGAYPEIFRAAGCGVLCPSADARELAAAWGALLRDPARRTDEARRGREAVARLFNLDRMARETAAYYAELTRRPAAGRVLPALLVRGAIVVAFAGLLLLAARGCRGDRMAVAAPPAPPHATAALWQRSWRVPVGAHPAEAPAPYRAGFVAATGGGVVAAVENSGRLAWRQTFSNLVFRGAPAVAGETAVVCTEEGDVVALDLAAGAVRWQTRVEGTYLHGPLALQRDGVWQVVLLCQTDGVLRALDAGTGHAVWVSDPTMQSDGSPGVEGEWLAYGNCDAAVHLFRAADGRHVARVPVGEESQMAGGTLVSGGRVFAGARSGELICVDAASAAVVWRAPVGGEDDAYATPVAVGDTVCLASRNGAVFAFAARDGSVRWQAALGHAVQTLCVADDTLFALSNGALVALRARDGVVLARLAVGDEVKGPVWNGQVLAALDDGGNLVGFRRRR